jgi:hypothetical protein
MFSNTVKAEWLEGEPRAMKLLEDLSFTDSSGKIWLATAGSIVDGASIPRFFWRVIGSPFVGLYRRASVIHDVYCESRTEPHEAVHKMFREAMLADGVDHIKAATMFKAVLDFGPKWDDNGNDIEMVIDPPLEENLRIV